MEVYGRSCLLGHDLQVVRARNEAMAAFTSGSMEISFTELRPKKGKKMNKKQMAKKIYALEDRLDKVNESRASDAMSLGNQITDLKKQVNCAEDYGHDYVFAEKVRRSNPFSTSIVTYLYRYKCSRCGRTVDYTRDELTVKDKNALKTLGIVE